MSFRYPGQQGRWESLIELCEPEAGGAGERGIRRRALFAISSLGLGHATRSLPVLRAFLDQGYDICLVSTGKALAFLQSELAVVGPSSSSSASGRSPEIRFCDLPDYPPLERGTGWRLYLHLITDLLRTWAMIQREHRLVEQVAAGFDFIFSDGRYGFYSRQVPNAILSHQIALIPPHRLRHAAGLTRQLNLIALKRFDRLFIPDFPDPVRNLSGRLAHSSNLRGCRHRFVGLLSSYTHLGLEQDIDYLFVISGYLVEHRGGLIQNLLEQARDLPGHKVFILGGAEEDAARFTHHQSNQLQIHALASGEDRQQLFNRARVLISRAGYTTIMDLVEHGKRAVLIPTPNQTEQEYLAQYLANKRHFAIRRQDAELDLSQALRESESSEPFEPPWRSQQSLQLILGEIQPLLEQRRFSILVPAHNEERELAATLEALLAQDYPAESYEILVIENGSSDRTQAIAAAIAARPEARGRLRLLTSPRGVSRAKNAGLDALSPATDWVIICDADTRLGPGFLRECNTWLHRQPERVCIGTTAVRPQAPGDTRYARLWFRAYDGLHRLTRTSFSIQLVDARIARVVRFDERLAFSEDLKFIRDCRRKGRFALMPTSAVTTSTRRFRQCGYLRQSLRWSMQALMPMRQRRKRDYDVVR